MTLIYVCSVQITEAYFKESTTTKFQSTFYTTQVCRHCTPVKRENLFVIMPGTNSTIPLSWILIKFLFFGFGQVTDLP